MAEPIGKVLIKKLTKEELREFCTAWDDGSLDDVVYNELIPQDQKNYPEDYITEDDDVREAQRKEITDVDQPSNQKLQA